MPLSKAVFEGRFGRPVRRPVPMLNEGAHLLVLPVANRKLRTIRLQHGGCPECNGLGVVFAPGGDGKPDMVQCPECKGYNSFWDSYEVRLQFLKEHVKGAEGVKLFEDGKPVAEAPFDDTLLETIAEMDREFTAVLMTCVSAALEIEASEGKG